MSRISINQDKLAVIERRKRLEELRETFRDPWEYDALSAAEKTAVKGYALTLLDENARVPERPQLIAQRRP